MVVNSSKGEKIFNVINILFMIILCIIMVYPVAYVVGRSFMTELNMAQNPLSIIPGSINLEGYQFIFKKGSYVLNSYYVTIMRAIVGTIANLFFTTLLGYVLSKKNYPLRNFITILVVFTMWFSGGLIPNFILIRTLKLADTFAVYIVPTLISAWNLILLRNFFMAIPAEIDESARIDGATDFTILFRIYIPLSTAVLATLALFYCVDHWNSWFDTLMYSNNSP